jgi:hypothetical protein
LSQAGTSRGNVDKRTKLLLVARAGLDQENKPDGPTKQCKNNEAPHGTTPERYRNHQIQPRLLPHVHRSE